MGRRPKTQAEHELNGTFEKHPERKARYAKQPKPEGPLGEPPASFDSETHTGSRLIEIWKELVSQAPPGVLTSSDRIHVEMACRLIHRIRFLSPKSGDFSRLDALLGKMAMNPSDRTKVNIAPGGGGAAVKDSDVQAANRFQRLAAEQRASVN